MQYLIADWLYDALKWFGLILCPAMAALVGAVGPAWGMPHVDQVVLTINAVGVFAGALIGASQVAATGKHARGE